MTRVSPSHLLANRAVLAVCTVLERAGALAETIKNDYGEDLLIQTHLNGIADNFHLLIQVKGTNLKADQDGFYSLRIDMMHLHRWTSHMQPVLVCVFDERTGKTYAFAPQRRFTMWELATTEKKSLTVKLNEHDIFDEGTAGRYIWDSRITFYSRMLAWNESQHNYVEQYPRPDDVRRRIKREEATIVFFFLKSVRLFDDQMTIDPRFVSGIENASINLARMNKESASSADAERGNNLTIESVFTLGLLGHVAEIASGAGLPSNLLHYGAEMAEKIFQHHRPKEWKRASQRFSTCSTQS